MRYQSDFLHTGGAAVRVLGVVGGLLHSAGAVVCALQRPAPSPRWFGFHDVFHALAVAAFTAHCTHEVARTAFSLLPVVGVVVLVAGLVLPGLSPRLRRRPGADRSRLSGATLKSVPRSGPPRP